MDATDVAAALTSAILHAGWNAAVKASRDPPRAMTAQMLLSALFVLPGLLWSGLPPPRSVRSGQVVARLHTRLRERGQRE